MSQLLSQSDVRKKRDFRFGILIAQTEGDGRHTGIVYRDEDEQLQLLHLAFHKLLLKEPFQSFKYANKCLTVLTSLAPEQIIFLSGMCEVIHKKNAGNIPYGISFTKDRVFSNEGEYFANSEGHGLTCSTFILEMFRFLNLELLDLDSWVSRSDDLLWQESILKQVRAYMVKKNILDETHLDASDKFRTGFRYRPEEVAGSWLETDRPVSFLPAEARGISLLNDLKKEVDRAYQLSDEGKYIAFLKKKNASYGIYDDTDYRIVYLEKINNRHPINFENWIHVSGDIEKVKKILSK